MKGTLAAAQNSGRTAKARGRPFVKGQSGNPGGRPRGLVAEIRTRTNDGVTLVGFMLRVFEGKLRGARLRDRIEAATWLADRGFGRPVQAPDLYRVLTAEQAEALFSAVTESVKRHVTDRAALKAISDDLMLLGSEHRLLTGAALDAAIERELELLLELRTGTTNRDHAMDAPKVVLG